MAIKIGPRGNFFIPIFDFMVHLAQSTISFVINDQLAHLFYRRASYALQLAGLKHPILDFLGRIFAYVGVEHLLHEFRKRMKLRETVVAYLMKGDQKDGGEPGATDEALVKEYDEKTWAKIQGPAGAIVTAYDQATKGQPGAACGTVVLMFTQTLVAGALRDAWMGLEEKAVAKTGGPLLETQVTHGRSVPEVASGLAREAAKVVTARP